MFEVLLSEHAADEFKQLPRAQRSSALKVMQSLEENPSARTSMRVKSPLLNTTLFEIRKAGLRFIYEIDGRRTVVLLIETNRSGA